MDGMKQEVQALLAQGRKIQAIKLVRERNNWGLKDAKAYVDKIALERITLQSKSNFASDDLDWQLRELMAQGKKIQAIQLVREHKTMGLKEAKKYVESLG